MKIKKKTLKWLVIALSVCFVTSLFSSLIQSSFGRVKVNNYSMTLTEIAEEITANNEEAEKDVEISFTQSTTAKMSFKVLAPKTATAENPAPAIVVMHGGLSNKETPIALFIEWARRGFVVISFDAMGHGKTDKAVDDLTHATMGMEAIVEYAMSLPYVNENQVGVTGHSWGNNGSVNVLNQINLNTSNKIAAMLIAQGTMAIFDIQAGALDNVIYGFSVGRYDEMDTYYLNSYNFETSPIATGYIKEIYPEFNETTAPTNVWYTAEGVKEVAAGEKIDATEARVLYIAENTHPGALFSKTATKINIDFFYNAFGTPSGAKYISSDNQVWPVQTVFSVLGMFSWLALAFPIIDIMLQLPAFRKLRKKEDGPAEVLPAFKSPKESIPLIAMFTGLTIFAALSIIPLTTAGAKYVPTTSFFPNASHQSNAFGFWSFISALVAIAAAYIVTIIKRFLYKNDKTYAPPALLKSADVGGRTIVLNIALAMCLTAIMYAIVFIVEGIFKVDFRIATVEFTTFRLDKIFVLLRYAPFMGLFYLVNAILVANTRFKDLPDWASTGIVVLGNALGLIIFAIVEYSTLFKTGLLLHPEASSTCTLMFALFIPMILGPIVARYTYNRTGNVWLGATFNTLLFTMALVGTGQYMYQNITMFGL